MTQAIQPAVRASPPLEQAILFTFVAHALAMVCMALLLLPGMPGGSTPDLAGRAIYIASHPMAWRIGWFSWQLTALSDLLLSIALFLTPWIDRRLSFASLLIILLALIPDQIGQFRWITQGIDLARSESYATYAQFELHTFRLIAGWGTIGYLATALFWTWCFAKARTWSRLLTWLSVVTWTWFGLATCNVFLPDALRQSRPISLAVSLGNALGFICLMLWLALVGEAVLRRSRTQLAWHYPTASPWGRFINLLATSQFLKLIAGYIPVAAMASDITDVVYVNYLVPANRIAHLGPPYLELQRLGPSREYAVFSFLMFRHDHFGPLRIGLLRRLWPSPIQSNWRLYATDSQTGKRGVLFLDTAIMSTPHALATRWLCEGISMHIPAGASLERDADGTVRFTLDPGNGTSPDAHGELRPSDDPSLPSPWTACFSSWKEMLDYVVPQDRALSSQPWHNRVTRQEIDLGIHVQDCRRLTGKIISRHAAEIAGDGEPICFLVDRVDFRFYREDYDVRT